MEVGGAANLMLLLPLKSRSGAFLMLYCGFFDCITDNRSNAELYLLLPEHRGETCRKCRGFLGGGAGGDAGVVGGGDDVDAFGDDVGDIRLSEKNRRRLVYAATAKSPGASSRRT